MTTKQLVEKANDAIRACHDAEDNFERQRPELTEKAKAYQGKLKAVLDNPDGTLGEFRDTMKEAKEISERVETLRKTKSRAYQAACKAHHEAVQALASEAGLLDVERPKPAREAYFQGSGGESEADDCDQAQTKSVRHDKYMVGQYPDEPKADE